uniref:OSJNBb0050N09.7 protein n=2 Tax=Oryza sativa subsp. japonica TaxID=39947 RepID=Q7XQW2_ORYSJ|nr:OSJNBb0050N09.7 [Oryza sativa Japonica Group]
MAGTAFSDLPPELMAKIHDNLAFLDRLAFAAAVSAPSRDALKPEPPWLVLPGETQETTRVFSLADRRSATVRAPDPAMRDHVIIGSSGGWIATADERGRMRLANPVTGEQGDLPAIATIPFLKADQGGRYFVLIMEPFVQLRYRGELESWPLRPHPYGTFTLTDGDMRRWFYRKVVLSASPRPGDYAAMLLLGNYFGTPAFATAEDGRWRVTPSRDGVEDAIHHKGKFLSVTYTGTVEAWERDGVHGEFTSKVVTTRMANGGDHRHCSKYLAAAPDGRLMIVLKNAKRVKDLFELQVFDEKTQRWEAAEDVGDLAILVGINSSLCVSTTEHPELKAGCVYYTDDKIGKASLRRGARCSSWYHRGDESHNDDSDRNVAMYSLKDGTAESIPELGEHLSWPPPACSYLPSHDRCAGLRFLDQRTPESIFRVYI